jgi:hypothetical protein
MTNLRQAAQAVVERWDTPAWEWRDQGPTADLMADLRTALAQPEQEPVAWAVQGCSKMWRDEFAEIDAKAEAKRIGGTCVAYALYTTPPAAQRPWQGLTDEEILRADPWEILRADPWRGPSDSNINPYQILLKVRTLEAKLKERNT